MKVILQDTVQKLGKAGDIVEIKRGYFRNYLEPRGLAMLATKGTLKKREEDIESYKRKAAKAHQEMVDLAAKINALPALVLAVKAGESGKLYGKITNKEIAQLIEKQMGQEIDKRLLKTTEIAALGTYKAHIKLSSDVQAEVTLEVVQEGRAIKETAAPVEEKPADSQEVEEQVEE